MDLVQPRNRSAIAFSAQNGFGALPACSGTVRVHRPLCLDFASTSHQVLMLLPSEQRPTCNLPTAMTENNVP